MTLLYIVPLEMLAYVLTDITFVLWQQHKMCVCIYCNYIYIYRYREMQLEIEHAMWFGIKLSTVYLWMNGPGNIINCETGVPQLLMRVLWEGQGYKEDEWIPNKKWKSWSLQAFEANVQDTYLIKVREKLKVINNMLTHKGKWPCRTSWNSWVIT